MSNILETFLILFESDAAEVKKGAKEADKEVDNLQQNLNAMDRASHKAGASFLAMAREAAGALAAIVSVGVVVNSVMDAARLADRLDETSEAIGVSVEELSAWGDAAKIAGGSSEAFVGTLKGMAAAMTQMDVTGKSRLKPFFDEIGVQMLDVHGRARPVLDIFGDLSEKFEGMTKEQSTGFGRKLGLDEGTIMLLQRGRRGLDELIARQKELGVITAKDGQVAADFFDALDDFSHAWRSIAMNIGTAVLPVLTGLLHVFQDIAVFVRQNGPVIQGFIIAVAGAILYNLAPAMLAAFWNMVRMSVMSFLLSVQMLGLAGALGVVAGSVWAMLSPILMAIAIVAIFALVWDDFMNFLDGSPSIIGRVADAISDIFGWLAQDIRGVFIELKEWVNGVVDWVMNKYKAVKSFFGFGDDVQAGMEMGRAAIGQASAPISATSSGAVLAGSRSTKNQTVNIGEVNVQTQATDADGIAKGIGDTMGAQMRQTISNMDDGIRG